MRRLNSAEFKREYRKLTEPVLVTVGNKSLGVWTPTIHRADDYRDGKAKPSRNQVPATTGLVLPEPPYNPPQRESDPIRWFRPWWRTGKTDDPWA